MKNSLYIVLGFIVFFSDALAQKDTNETKWSWFVSYQKETHYQRKASFSNNITYASLDRNTSFAVSFGINRIISDHFFLQAEAVVTERFNDVVIDKKISAKIYERFEELPILAVFTLRTHKSNVQINMGLGPNFAHTTSQQYLVADTIALPEAYRGKQGNYIKLGLIADVSVLIPVYGKKEIGRVLIGFRSTADLFNPVIEFKKSKEHIFYTSQGIYLGYVSYFGKK